VAATVGDLVDSGYVQSLARPGGNITGFPAFDLDMGGKWVELLHEIAPATRRILVLENINTQRASFLPKIEIAAKQFDISIAMPALSGEPEIGPAIDHFARDPGGGLIVLPTPFTSTHRHPIISAAARNRLPAIYPFRFFAEDGGLIVYGSDGRDIFRRAASYVDRILRGEKPENLPIQQPTKFEMIVNLKTARSLGLSVPPVLITTADEVIE
jgi:putative ABC transport system substrate-binding protein